MKSSPFILCAAFLAALFTRLSATEPAPAQVINREVMRVGDGYVIYELIVPPVVSAEPVVVAAGSPTAALPRQIVSLSCTVYGREFTELRWRDAAGGEYVVWSSLDLTPFTGRSSGGFDLGGVHYEIVMGLGDAPAAEAAAPLAAFREIVPPAGPGSWYAALQQPETISAGAYDGVNALHVYFDANKAAIAAEHEAVKAANAARKAWEAAHPPVKQDTVIRFWPIKSALHGVDLKGEAQP